MSKPQFFSIFSGIGGSAFGAKAAGYELLGAIEFDPQIADLYSKNHRSLIAVDDVKNINPLSLPDRNWDIDLCLQLSPPCQEFSGSNCHQDRTSDRAVALDHCYKILDYYQPEQIVIENVRAYQQSPSMDKFRDWLTANRYHYIEQIINCADLGVPQTRIRYFLIATKIGRVLRPCPLTHSQKQSGQTNLFAPQLRPWIGWYEAIEDIISSMPLTELSPNQLKSLRANHPPLIIESRTRSRGEHRLEGVRTSSSPAMTVLSGNSRGHFPKLLIPTIGYHGDTPPTYPESQPAPTVKAMMMSDRGSDRKGCWKLTDDYEVRECSVGALARFQTFPDDLILSGRNSLDCKSVGNAVPPVALKSILDNCFS
jgi:DNA (cytosine-5)-methyltransferase 1